ncbi:hypothetical protein [Gelidibacter mesophilus]|uniref:hypothetical protein n=1 Tax=Gelidibacter mesophilus TaxID=169050 RepID=UPI0004067517|nr:hypothetical protein [Gelidibacter mesophilus]
MRNFITIGVMLVFLALSCASSKNIAKHERDGSTYEKAVIVNSIVEEYEYVKKDCQGCQLLGQSLSHYKNKPYDILSLKKLDGEEVAYYFDISKFFGKGF